MIEYKVESLAEFYKQVKPDILNGSVISPRGKETIEIIAPQILLTNPRNRIAYNKDRRFSPKYAFIESLLLFDNTNRLEYYSKHNSNIANFSDDGEHLYGAYGYRIADYIPRIVEKLKNDNESRQIVLPILRIEDVVKDTKDIPCTLNLQLIIREGKLNMIVNMRSNDIIWGVPYDVFMFTMFQEIIANELGIEMGWYLHRPISLHLYKDHYELFEKVADNFENVEVVNPYNIQKWLSLKDIYKQTVVYEGFTGFPDELHEAIVENVYEKLILNKIKGESNGS